MSYALSGCSKKCSKVIVGGKLGPSCNFRIRSVMRHRGLSYCSQRIVRREHIHIYDFHCLPPNYF